VRGEICGVVGNYVWRGGLALYGFLCVDSGGLFQVIVCWDTFVQLKDNMCGETVLEIQCIVCGETL